MTLHGTLLSVGVLIVVAKFAEGVTSRYRLCSSLGSPAYGRSGFRTPEPRDQDSRSG